MPPKRKCGEAETDTPRKEAKKRVRVEVYNDEDADVVLVSSDKVAFRVHSFYLEAARSASSLLPLLDALICSPVFRGMLQGGTGESEVEVEFTDEKLEKASTLGLLLDIISKPFTAYDHLTYDDAGNLIRLAEKYSCDLVLQTIALYLEQPTTSGSA
jgi:hypothetical protein